MTAAATLDLARASGVVLSLAGNEVCFEPPIGGVPRSLIEQIRTHKAAIRAILIAEKYGPLTRDGKMCQRCWTINRCRAFTIGFICDQCRRDDDKKPL